MVNSVQSSSGNKVEEINEIRDLETEINDVISSCKSIIKNNYSVIKKKQNADKKKDKKDLSKVTLETVAQDMSNILENLKTHLGSAKKKQDSFSDVIPKLEELIKNKQINHIAQSKDKSPAKPNPPGIVAKQLSGKLPQKINNNINNTVNRVRQNVIKNMTHSRSSASTASKHPSSQIIHQRSNLSKLSIGSKRKFSNMSRPSSAERKWRRPQVAISREMYDPLGVLKDEVERAKQAEKTFTIRGSFAAVRRALLARGWVEKFHYSYRERVNDEVKKFQHYNLPELVEMLRNKEIAEVVKRVIKSKLLATHQVDFYWSYDYDGFRECSDKVKLTTINKLRRDGYSYTSKKGLCDASKKSWFNIPGLASMNHPRTYNLVRNGDTNDFIKDFSLTAAMSLLKWIMKNSVTHECKVISPSGKIPLSVFNFALNECYKFIKMSRNEATEYPEVFEHEWNEFLENYYKIVQFGNHFKQLNGMTETDMVRKSNYILTHLKDHWPFLDMDGIMNIWILKPINGSQGVGIHICRTLKYILGVIKSNPNRRYIVQKYIERPLLIYNTKFDIRQWFIIGSSVPLTIWIYKHSYLRFSSQTYSLRKLHESIHLTNNSVQSRYGKYQKDIALPPYNMWDSTQFKNYLSDIGYPNVFSEIIYPGMKQCIAAAVLIHKDKLDRRRHCFELQGADFILTEDFKPWLLEINSSPALHASTPVTARMCPAVLEDVIKVVVDHEKNNKANTGAFELIFDERIHGATLKDHALPTAKPNFVYTHPLHDLNSCVENPPKPPLDTDAAEYIKQIGVGLRKTLTNLLQILKNEKEKRQFKKNKSIDTISSNNIIPESRRHPLTRKAERVSPVVSRTGKASHLSISSKKCNTSSKVSVKTCPASLSHQMIPEEKVSEPKTEDLQISCISSNATLVTIDELAEAMSRNDDITENSVSCVVYVQGIITNHISSTCSFSKFSNKISNVTQKPDPPCEILICPLNGLNVVQTHNKIRVLETDESLIPKEFLIKDVEMLNMPSPPEAEGKEISKPDIKIGDEVSKATVDSASKINEAMEIRKPDIKIGDEVSKATVDSASKINEAMESFIIQSAKINADKESIKITPLENLNTDVIEAKSDEIKNNQFNDDMKILNIEESEKIMLKNQSATVIADSVKDMEMLNMPSSPEIKAMKISEVDIQSSDEDSTTVDFTLDFSSNINEVMECFNVQSAKVNADKEPAQITLPFKNSNIDVTETKLDKMKGTNDFNNDTKAPKIDESEKMLMTTQSARVNADASSQATSVHGIFKTAVTETISGEIKSKDFSHTTIPPNIYTNDKSIGTHENLEMRCIQTNHTSTEANTSTTGPLIQITDLSERSPLLSFEGIVSASTKGKDAELRKNVEMKCIQTNYTEVKTSTTSSLTQNTDLSKESPLTSFEGIVSDTTKGKDSKPRENLEIKYIQTNHANTVANTSTISSLIQNTDLSKKSPMSSFEGVGSNTSKGRDRRSKPRKQISFTTHNKTSCIKQMVRRSLNRIFCKKIKLHPPCVK